MHIDNRYRQIRNVTLIGAVLDLVLGASKIVAGSIGNSQALIADGIHSLSDLLTDGLVLFAAKHGSREADEEHPYGHARIETMMTVALGMALIAVALGLGYDAVERLFHEEKLLQPGLLALVVAGISILSKEAIYQYTMVVAKKLRSNMLIANAWHSRSDAISSIIVFVGVLGSMFGLTYLDAIATIGVVYMIAKLGWDLSWTSIRELVDTALDIGRVETISKFINEIDGVDDLHMLRTRRMGADALVDVHIQVGSRLSVSEGHYISEIVRNRLIKEFDEISDVMVHIDPEDDEKEQACVQLPLRGEFESYLTEAWKDISVARDIKSITLHYLDGKIHIDIELPLSACTDVTNCEQISETLKSASQSVENLGDIKVSFR